MARSTVVFDANVLIAAPVRDLLLRVAEAGLVRAQMSDDILDEVERVLVTTFNMPEDKAHRLREHLERALDDGVIARGRYGDLRPVGLPDPDDEHVVAAARAAGAQAIVTLNLKDFPSEQLAPFAIEARHPDDFVLDLIDLHPLRIARIVEQQVASLRKPAKTYDEVLDSLARTIPETAGRLRER